MRNFTIKNKTLLFISFCLLPISFTSCSKTDYNKLEGTTWQTETEAASFTLRFLSESVCTIATTVNDNTDSANMTSYSWRYGSDIDSQWGLFHLYKINENEENPYIDRYSSGTIKDKKLYLYINSENEPEPLCFTRK